MGGSIFLRMSGRVHCFVECTVSSTQNKALNAAPSKAKGRVPWHNDCPTPEINSMAVKIAWMQLVTITINDAVVINKMVLQNQLLHTK